MHFGNTSNKKGKKERTRVPQSTPINVSTTSTVKKKK